MRRQFDIAQHHGPVVHGDVPYHVLVVAGPQGAGRRRPKPVPERRRRLAQIGQFAEAAGDRLARRVLGKRESHGVEDNLVAFAVEQLRPRGAERPRQHVEQPRRGEQRRRRPQVVVRALPSFQRIQRGCRPARPADGMGKAFRQPREQRPRGVQREGQQAARQNDRRVLPDQARGQPVPGFQRPGRGVLADQVRGAATDQIARAATARAR
jgi:hypothetical protein